MEVGVLREVAVKVSQYFRDFLESDFKRQQAPRRRIVFQTDAGFKAGMRLRPYPGLDAEFWKLLSKPTGDTLEVKLTPRKYTRPLSATLARVIDEQILAIPEARLTEVQIAVLAKVSKTLPQAATDPERWIDGVRSELSDAVCERVVRPLIGQLEGFIKTNAYSVMDSLYATETEMVAAVASDLDTVLPATLAQHLARPDGGDLRLAIANFLTLAGVHAELRAFFANFVTADAFLEFRDLETYASITDGHQVYLYIGAFKFRNVQYPLFFIPVEAQKLPEGEGYSLTLSNQIFANRRAIDFTLQELAQGRNREWVTPIEERISYVAPLQSVFEVIRGLFRLVATAMDMGGQIELGSQAQDVTTAEVQLTSALYICAFERGEESLVNDYEELIDMARRGGSAVVDLFQDMVGKMLEGNPVSIASQVSQQWEDLPMVDRMVFDSPIPLNEEQRKVLLAVNNPEGRIIVVEGPPGTGKSHTITAIAADCAFNQKSCLVLSDKLEALQVVQDKLSSAMSRVRHDPQFPNPILRLGRQNANFKRLVSNQTINQVSAYARAMKANAGSLADEKQDTANNLRTAIAGTVTGLGSVSLADIEAMHRCESQLRGLDSGVLAVLQLQADTSLLTQLAELPLDAAPLQHYFESLFAEGDFTPGSLHDRVLLDDCLEHFSQGRDLSSWSIFERLDADEVRVLSRLLLTYEQLRMPLVGYLFRGAQVRELEQTLNDLKVTRPTFLKQAAKQLNILVADVNALRAKLEPMKLGDRLAEAYGRLARGIHSQAVPTHAVKVVGVLERFPDVLREMLAKPEDDARLWPLVIAFLRTWLTMRKVFEEAPQYDYVGTKTKLERLNTSLMNAHVDSRLVQFMDEHRADAKVLAKLVTERQKFPEEKFDAVRSSFPVIIASIREFGEYMPLVPEQFDVLVIDEASQVSVAQALPAILRAKKVVVLGDSKQFSNVKSSNASNALNDKYRAGLVNFFERNTKADAAALQRLSMFDVKRSVLEFCSMAASYTIMLRKHFRSYPELIGYSSTTFYDHQLQAIKVRGRPISDVIRFDQIEVAGKTATRATNQAEADFIEAQLLALLDRPVPPTVGIITPFREQHTLLTKRLFGHARAPEFEKTLRLKVMTFDSCQGEEREIIFYSMVASRGQDALNYIFPVELTNAQENVEEKLKMQRLNVGFSRAQETIWIVHSMPIDEFRGSIAGALNHYRTTLKKKEVLASTTDQSSPMEAKILGWLQATTFVQSQPDTVEIVPQFPIGDYLKQLDPLYEHPAYRVDFLLTCETTKGVVSIVVEYDGFEYHFDGGAAVNVGNHARYLKVGDVERQLTLESYGYRFLRVNRFNLGKDPVATLDERLLKLMQVATGETTTAIVDRLREQAAGLVSKELKACSRCGEIRTPQDYFDQDLRSGVGGYGRICMICKQSSRENNSFRTSSFGRSAIKTVRRP